MDKIFRKRLLKRESLIGIMVTVADQAILEALARIGFDWLFIETEHAPKLAEQLNGIVLAAGGVPCLVRLSRNDEISVKRALDSGAAGIIAPRVNSVDTCRKLVDFAKFPPLGSRGIGIARANQYGVNVRDYVDEANSGVSVVIQIEDREGIENLEEMLEIDGVDAVFIGPYDLSASIGHIGELDHQEIQNLIEHARLICSKARIPIGIFESDCIGANRRLEQGFSLITISSDISCIIHQTKSLLQNLSR